VARSVLAERFAPSLKQNLDGADEVYRSINRSIDKFIAEHAISAPSEAPYEPVWEPTTEITELDARAANLSAVVWCIGFGSDFRWVKLPIFDERGHPEHVRGITPVPGLYFLGLPWLHTWGSGRFAGVGSDARHLASKIRELSSQRAGSRPRIGSARAQASRNGRFG